MKNIFKKIIFVFVGSICLLSGVNAITTTEDDVAYYTLDNVLTDATGNGYTLINNGATYTSSGFINGAYSFDGTGNYLQSTIDETSFDQTFSYSIWFYADTIKQQYITSSDAGTSKSAPLIRLNADGTIFFSVRGNTAQVYDLDACNGFTYSATTWTQVIMTYDGSSLKCYIDGTFKETTSGTTGTWTTGWADIPFGKRSDVAGDYFDGKLDEIAIFDYTLTQTNITNLYNSAAGLQHPYIVSLPTPTISHNVQPYYNTIYPVFNLSTTTNVNMSFILNNNPESNICFDCNSTSINLTFYPLVNPIEGTNNITFISTDINGQANSTANFIVDLTIPVIQIIGNLTQQQFEVNFSNIFNVTDNLSGLDTCNLNITYLENVTNSTQYNKFINCTDTTTFQANGLYNGFLEAVDLAGNIATLSINGTIETVVDVNFFQLDTTPITNYDYELISPSGFTEIILNNSNPAQISPVINGSLDLGNWTLIFTKSGFITTNFTIPINLTSGGEEINKTVGISLLYLNIFDTNTNYLILQDVDIQLIGPDFAGDFTTSTGLITITNITNIPGFYQILLNSNDYVELSYIFQHTGFEAVNLSLFMQPLNDTIPILYTVQDKLGNKMGSSDEFPRCLVQVSEYDISTNSYILQTMDYTNSNGEVIFEIDTTKNIKNTVICDSSTFIFDGEKITSTPVLLTIGTEAIEYFDSLLNVAYVPINYTQVNNVTGRFTFTYSDSNGILTQACLNVNEKVFNGEIFIEEKCLTISSGSINIDFNTSQGQTFVGRANFIYLSTEYEIPSYVKVIVINSEDLGLIGLFLALLLVFSLSLAGLSMPQGGKALGVMFGATIALWASSVINLIPMNYYVLTTWSILLIMGAIFS